MQKWIILVLLLAVVALWARGQEIVPATVPAVVTTMGTPLPSSVRASVPMSPTDPGTEGQLAMDDLYLYSYHAGIWKKSPRLNL